ncbi:MAG TPA: hypothetical protein VF944_04635 [Candidatus Bathyarchaeia archaeon]
MPEAEVALDLAWHLLNDPRSRGLAEVSIDGAQVRVAGKTVFRIVEFLRSNGWHRLEKGGTADWNGVFGKNGLRLCIDSEPGKGDVRVRIGDRRIVAECKGGPIAGRKGNPEYPRLREAIGQLMTVKEVLDGDLLVVAVPDTPPFKRRAEEFRRRPLIAKLGIRFVLVDEHGLDPVIP